MTVICRQASNLRFECHLADPVGRHPATLTDHKIYPNGFGLLRYRWPH